jgi:hypothetical protein
MGLTAGITMVPLIFECAAAEWSGLLAEKIGERRALAAFCPLILESGADARVTTVVAGERGIWGTWTRSSRRQANLHF